MIGIFIGLVLILILMDQITKVNESHAMLNERIYHLERALLLILQNVQRKPRRHKKTRKNRKIPATRISQQKRIAPRMVHTRQARQPVRRVPARRIRTQTEFLLNPEADDLFATEFFTDGPLAEVPFAGSHTVRNQVSRLKPDVGNDGLEWLEPQASPARANLLGPQSPRKNTKPSLQRVDSDSEDEDEEYINQFRKSV